ncbi:MULTISPECIES: response regulator transcription factor [Paraburkholderia]|uniref:response regulator transcription factor n=1 Tax=Paraburkholderia TaxID=1822464 RepID=UPI0006D3F858|nr:MULTISPECIES: response regulator transcription factor [Paraburkholderia]ALP65473.1 two-component system response regulator [Paraburkholderia caribensis]AMV46649.1 two-component system response regulator [Paraburkholderia caribensis]AUT55610.1 DNA-binding response regulator [Paraburkholderia caribensis]MDR6385990.1 two-component system response regulator EvgA [Paraburkholderia caribensis]CAG9196847.1 Putative transcriptional regulator [Paraburkholderia caribensis]
MASILIVDDHPAFRLVIKTHLLQLLGTQEVFEADNGQSAMEMARQFAPDLTILDLDIPRINGLDVLSRLKTAHPSMRVLILSSHDASTFVSRAMRAGAQGFVSKAQDVKEIMRSVEAVMSGYSVFPVAPSASIGAAAQGVVEERKLELLSDKELVILQMLAKGMSNKTIGDALFISNKTVSSHKTRLMTKVGVATLVDLVDFARRCGIAAARQ